MLILHLILLLLLLLLLLFFISLQNFNLGKIIFQYPLYNWNDFCSNSGILCIVATCLYRPRILTLSSKLAQNISIGNSIFIFWKIIFTKLFILDQKPTICPTNIIKLFIRAINGNHRPDSFAILVNLIQIYGNSFIISTTLSS